MVRKLKLCMNCLGRHFVADCPSKFNCRTCNGRHHTSLHFDRSVEQQSGVTSGATFSGPSVLLSSAMVGIDDTAGKTLMFQALLDSGSQTSFITAEATSKLNLARSTVDVKISGIGGWQQAAKESLSLLVGPQKLPVTALVLNSIAGNIPSQSFTLKQLKSKKSVALADKKLPSNWPRPIAVGRGCVRGSLSGRKEEGLWASLSQVYLRLGGYWSVVPSACLPMSIIPSCSGTGSCSVLGS